MKNDIESAWKGVATSLRGYLLSRVPEGVVDDLLQDIFLKAFKQSGRLHEISNIEGWLFFIAKNAVIDHYRTTRPTEELPGDLEKTEDEPSIEEESGLRAAFRNLVENLPQPYRDALILTEYQGLTQKDLAERDGISLSAAKSRVQRGRQKLKEAILSCCELDFDRRGKVIDCQPKQGQGCECN